MDTKNVTVKKNESLFDLSIYTKLNIEILTENILKILLKYTIIHDIKEECGEDLSYALSENGFTVEAFTVCCFNVCTPKLIEIMNGLQLWGVFDECPKCGCEVLEYKCENPECDYQKYILYEPDYDSLKGGHDYKWEEFYLN